MKSNAPGMKGHSRSFFDSACMFICEHITLSILDINEHSADRFGYTKEEFQNMSLFDLGNAIVTDKNDTNKPSVNGNKVSGSKWIMRSKDGNTYITECSSQLIQYAGKVCKLIVAHDVTSLETEEKSRDQLKSVPVMLQDFPMANIEWSPDLTILHWSENAENLFGFTSSEAVKEEGLMQSFIHQEDIGYMEQTIAAALGSEVRNTSLLIRNITKDGRTISCEWYNSFLFDADGELVSVNSLVSDVTERVEAMEKSLRVMESYRDLFDSISDAIYLINDSGRIIGASKGLQRTFGYEPSEVTGKPVSLLHAPGKVDSTQLAELFSDTEKNGLKLKSWGRKKNGEVFPSELLVNNGSYFGEEVRIIIERDVTERQMAEEELLKRERLLSELFNTTPLGIALLNEHHEVVEVNHGFEEIFGYNLDEIKGLDLDRIIVRDEDLNEAQTLSSTLKVRQMEARRVHSDGELIDVMIYSVPIIIDSKVIYRYGFYVDISERKRNEEEVRASLREKEVLLSEIHHRVKNNLAVITGLLELQSYKAEDSAAVNLLKDSQMRIHSIAMVHEKLYQNERLSEIHIHKYIRDLVRIVQKTMGDSRTELSVEYDLDEVKLAITQAIPCGLLLNEVLTNAFKHAFAKRKKGVIRIYFKKEEGELIRFGIEDDGIGFDPDNIHNEEDSLGMSLIHTLARQLKAKSKISSDDKGSSFSFLFEKN